jgi:hypothetical protein
MAFLDNSGDIILDAVLTDTGRHRLARGDGSFRIAKFALGDDEINYTLYDKTNQSGSAYYDLSILQTPVLEAFTNNTSLMKSKLISIPRTNLLYLPVIVQNTKDTSGKPYANIGGESYLVLVDGATETDFGAGLASGILKGASSNGNNYIRADQGLNTTEIPVTFPLDADLVETQYIVEIDNRLGQLTTTQGNGTANVSFIDDDQIASYYFSLNTDPGYVMIPDGATADPASGNTTGDHNQIAGPRGTIIKFGIKASIDLNSSTFLFTQLGDTITGTSLGAGVGGTTYRYIDSTVRISGATTGFRLDIPIRFIKKS